MLSYGITGRSQAGTCCSGSQVRTSDDNADRDVDHPPSAAASDSDTPRRALVGVSTKDAARDRPGDAGSGGSESELPGRWGEREAALRGLRATRRRREEPGEGERDAGAVQRASRASVDACGLMLAEVVLAVSRGFRMGADAMLTPTVSVAMPAARSSDASLPLCAASTTAVAARTACSSLTLLTAKSTKTPFVIPPRQPVRGSESGKATAMPTDERTRTALMQLASSASRTLAVTAAVKRSLARASKAVALEPASVACSSMRTRHSGSALRTWPDHPLLSRGL
eukprot:1652367-Rhodomonas_salina.2